MELTGKVVQLLPVQSGESKNGTWKKQEFIIETPGQYPKKVCVTVWGDRIDQFAIQEGEVVTASIELESREFNSRWYTDVRAWRLERDKPAQADAPAPTPAPAMPDEAQGFDNKDADPDDLPF